MKSKDGGEKKEILKRWKELLSKQPNALINATRSPLPMSPYICFCLSEQQSIREKLCREKQDVTLAVISKCVARSWDLLSPQGKVPYIEMAAAKAQKSIDSSPTTSNVMSGKKRSAADHRPREEALRSSLEIAREKKAATSGTEDVYNTDTKAKHKTWLNVEKNQVDFSSEVDQFPGDPKNDKTQETEEKLQSFSEKSPSASAADAVSDSMKATTSSTDETKSRQELVGFATFAQIFHPQVLSEHESYLSPDDVMKVLESVWISMPESEREPYSRIETE